MPEDGVEKSADKTALYDAAESALGFPGDRLPKAREILETLPARELKWIIAAQDKEQAGERFKKSLTPQEISGLFAAKEAAPKPLRLFFEQQIFPHFSDWEKDSLAMFHDLKFGKEQLQEEYEKFLKYDPATDKEGRFFNDVLMPFYMISTSDHAESFEDMIPLFMEKVTVLAETLYRDAFFRNRYDSLEAWQACARYKGHQELLKSLKVLPDGAEDRVAGMSKELDELWSQPEVERALENATADDLVESGMREESMLVKMYREESEPIPEREYDGYHELRPDLFPATYGEYLAKLEEQKHPYRLKL
jgi:hypothetical protein